MSEPTLAALSATVDQHLVAADLALARDFPGERSVRQPVHTVYVPAHQYDVATVSSWGERALAELDGYPDDQAFAAAIGLSASVVGEVMPRVRSKLEIEPIEDLRIDFEDGYAGHSEAQEDAAVRAAVAAIATSPQLTPSIGLRFKSFEAPTRARGLRTLHAFVGALAGGAGLPDGFVMTLPKVTSVAQVEAMSMVCSGLEQAFGLAEGALRFEIQVETPQAVIGPDGTALVARMIQAALGRCTGLHYGTYDYSASLGIAAGYQSMEHPAADLAKGIMQVAAAGTGVHVSDGSTNILPLGTPEQRAHGSALHARLVRRSLERGFYQGWDLHPAQLPSRYAATYAFFRDGLPSATQRVAHYAAAAQADSTVLDEPATIKALTGFLRRALDCGATDADELSALTGVDEPTLWARAAETPDGPAARPA